MAAPPATAWALMRCIANPWQRFTEPLALLSPPAQYSGSKRPAMTLVNFISYALLDSCEALAMTADVSIAVSQQSSSLALRSILLYLSKCDSATSTAPELIAAIGVTCHDANPY